MVEAVILPAQTIRRLRIISPCEPRTRLHGVTYGLGPAGYDLRIASSIKLFPGSAALGDAVERFDMPNDVMGILYTKSTWARVHIEVANTVLEPGWRGHLRLEISMHYGTKPINSMAGSGIAQVVFYRLEEETEAPYEGKYQDQGRMQDAIFES